MSDGNGNNGTSLALTEKRHGNNGGGGGCVGILFQLFDWHRRFATKKLFKRRLLPSPARAKQFVQKLKGDEKMPAAKHHMISDESKGGFPGVRKNGIRNLDAEQMHGTQAPGLVARLMGLESMPLVQQASRKNFKGETPNARLEKVVVGSRVVGKEDLNAEKGEKKRESRPSKLQNTRESDRRVMTQFGAEALQIKNVFTRSRKHHHQKHLTHVKSPRIPPANRSTSLTTSRLIDAASKILEPGLQNKNRIKCDLPYSSFVQKASEDTLIQRSQFLSPDIQTQNLESECLSYKPSMGKSSWEWENCGTLLEGMGSRQNMLEQMINHFHIVPQHLDDMCHKAEIVEGRPAFTVVLPQKAMSHRRGQEESVAIASSSMGNSLVEDHNDRQVKDANPSKEYWDECPLSRHKSNPLRDEMSVQERTMQGSRNSYLKGGRIPCSVSALTDDFANLNRSMRGRTHPRSPARADSSTADVRRTHPRRSGSTSEMKLPLQKMRSSSEHPSSASTSYTKQKSRSGSSGVGNRSRCIKDSDGVVSFTFHSPIRDESGFSDDSKNNKQGENDINEKIYSESKSGLGENFLSRFQQKHFALTGDAPGAILEEKLKELTSLEEEEDMISHEMPRRPTTVILQDLIAAVTIEPSVVEYGVIADSKTTFQMKPSIYDAPKVFHDANSFSPGSVLEVSFSNDSCVSSSFDDISGSKIHADLMDYSIDSAPVQDMELLDSATSLHMGNTHFVELTSLIDRLAGIMDGLTLADVRLAGSKVNLVKDIILHAELVFASFKPENFKYLEGVICALLQDVCTDLKRFFSLGDAKVGSEMRAFALDCLLECFDEDYRRCCNIGYKGWAIQFSSWSPEILSQDIVEKVHRWASLSGLTPDEIIENEMSNSLGKWTEFDIEAFELGAAFADDMLKDVVEEITVSILCPTC